MGSCSFPRPQKAPRIVPVSKCAPFLPGHPILLSHAPGVLIFVNFSLALLYFPALLVIEEERGGGSYDAESSNRRRASRTKRLKKLQDLHRHMWDNRLHLLLAFGLVALLAAPLALSLSPGADSSFTFAPDPQMTQIVARSRLPPPNGLFASAPGVNYSNVAAGTLPFSAATLSNYTPPRFYQMLQGTYKPPIDDEPGFWYGVWLSVFLVFDCALLVSLASVVHTNTPLSHLKPPHRTRISPSFIAGVASAGCASGLIGIVIGGLAVAVCDFATEMGWLIGGVLGV